MSGPAPKSLSPAPKPPRSHLPPAQGAGSALRALALGARSPRLWGPQSQGSPLSSAPYPCPSQMLMGSPLPPRLLLPSRPPPESTSARQPRTWYPHLWASPTLSGSDAPIPSPSWLHHRPGPTGFPPPRHPHLLHQQVLVGGPHPQSLLLASIPHAGPSHLQGQTWLQVAGLLKPPQGQPRLLRASNLHRLPHELSGLSPGATRAVTLL